ncbi:MAG: hypothetical protein QOE62_729, partial [Actinomycetota bacterium]|nr:hypothetical protein [Actinomycetota bacterium]
MIQKGLRRWFRQGSVATSETHGT